MSEIILTNTPYDDVFRTLLNDCTSLLSTIIEMSNKVVGHIAWKFEHIKEGVQSVMGGKVLEHEAKTIRNEGREEGRAEGRAEGIRGTVSVLKSLGIAPQTILAKIQEQYDLTPEISKKYL